MLLLHMLLLALSATTKCTMAAPLSATTAAAAVAATVKETTTTTTRTTILPTTTTTTLSVKPTTIMLATTNDSAAAASTLAAITSSGNSNLFNNSNVTANNNSRLRKRHSKRHSNWYDYFNFNESKTLEEWANPCGGYYVPGQFTHGGASKHPRRKNTTQIFDALKRYASIEFKTLNVSQQDIDISNIQIWSLHEYTYKFLPKLKTNSSIALKRWYRNIQTYVASFAYLRRVQLRWDHSKSQRESRTARELKLLLISSRAMLCELETAINNTQPLRFKDGKLQPRPPLQMISRTQMNKRLKLRSKRRADRSSADAVYEADTIDLKFVKYFYYEFLETMWKVLRKNMKRRGQVALRAQPKDFNDVTKSSMTLTSRRRGGGAGGSKQRKSARGTRKHKRRQLSRGAT